MRHHQTLARGAGRSLACSAFFLAGVVEASVDPAAPADQPRRLAGDETPRTRPPSAPPAAAAPVTPTPPSVPEPKPTIGHGPHAFDDDYLLFGVNWQGPCGSVAYELELSLVPFISDNLWWFGAYTGAGFQHFRTASGRCTLDMNEERENADSDPPNIFRASGGVELGWRMLAMDVGPVYNQAFGGKLGWRVRAGIAVAQELFTAGEATYAVACCIPDEKNRLSDTECECDRTRVGVSLFAYYAHEHYPLHDRSASEDWSPDPRDGMLGVSLKIGVGVW